MQFLTVITVVPGLQVKERDLRGSMSFFPVVGLVIGGLVAGFDWAVKGLWPPFITGVLSIVFLAILTRGLHLDGLADTADAVASGAERDMALEIMRDSANGALGILAMLTVLAIKTVCAVQLSSVAAWQWFVLVPCFSRTGLVVLGAFSRYARQSGGLGASFTGRRVRSALLLALPVAIASAWALAGLQALLMLLFSLMFALVAAIWADRKFGGVTGDILGAHVELQEAFLFLGAAALAG